MQFESTLTINNIEYGSTLYWCALVLRVAGTKVSYDCGMCSHTLNRELDGILEPTEEQRAEWESRWSLDDMYFKTPPFAQTPAVVTLFQTAKDR